MSAPLACNHCAAGFWNWTELGRHEDACPHRDRPAPAEGDYGDDPCPAVEVEAPCDHCGTEGRLYSGHPNDPNPRDAGECPACRGAGGVWTATEPVTEDEIMEPSL